MFTSALLHVLVIVVFQKKQISGQKYCEDDNVYFIKYFNKNLPAVLKNMQILFVPLCFFKNPAFISRNLGNKLLLYLHLCLFNDLTDE